jgi:tripartite-type tricarboxylate transporter receptor subunit TctC
MTNTSMTHIPYKGSPQVMTALISGEIHMYFVASASSALPQIQSNQIKALGVSGKDRLPILPDTPAVNDVVRGFEVLGWNGILAPSGTPKSIVEKLNTLINQVVSSSEFQQKLRAEGARSSSITAAEFGLLIQKDIQKWAGVIKKAGITPE